MYKRQALQTLPICLQVADYTNSSKAKALTLAMNVAANESYDVVVIIDVYKRQVLLCGSFHYDVQYLTASTTFNARHYACLLYTSSNSEERTVLFHFSLTWGQRYKKDEKIR